MTGTRASAEVDGRAATVIGRWGDDTALVRTDDGTTLEAPIPQALRERVDVGARVVVHEGERVDWRIAA